jgi:hypothetical protein
VASNFRLVIYDSKIAAMSLPGGQIFRWTLKRRERVEMKAILNAPIRYGTLKASIHGVYRPRSANHIYMEVHAEAEHALWVHEGTNGPITALGPWKMNLPAWGIHPDRRLWSVSGQRSQPFLRNALESVMRGEL